MAKRNSGSPKKSPQPTPVKKISRGTGPIFADIDNVLRREFHSISQKEGFTEKKAIESLVKYFVKSLTADERSSLLNNTRPLVKSLAKAIELMQWGQHSFTNRKWEWCSKVNRELVDECNAIPEIVRFAFYRLGYCHISMADGMKRELLDCISKSHTAGIDELHSAIDNALKAGMYYSSEAIKMGELSIARYNMACAYVMTAENAALRTTPWASTSDKWISELREDIAGWLLESKERQDIRDDGSVKHPWWIAFANGWQSHCDVESAKNSVEKLLGYSISELEKMVNLSDSSVIPSDSGELIRWVHTDLDMAFLRHERDFSPLYDAWRTTNELSSSRLATFQTLWAGLDDISAIESIEYDEIKNY